MKLIASTNMCSHLQRKLFEGEYRAFRDTETSVRKTVKNIQTHPLIPKDVTVRGFIIDSVTGELQEIK